MVFQKTPTEGSQKVRTRQFCFCQVFELRSPRSLCQSLVWAGSRVTPSSRCNPGFCSDCLLVLLLSLHALHTAPYPGNIFVHCIKLCKCITNIQTIHPLYIFISIYMKTFQLISLGTSVSKKKKTFKSKEFTEEKKNRENTTKENEPGVSLIQKSNILSFIGRFM